MPNDSLGRCRGGVPVRGVTDGGGRSVVGSGGGAAGRDLVHYQACREHEPALDRMVVLDQKLTMLDEGQAQLAEAIGQVEQDGKDSGQQMKLRWPA